MPNKRIQSDLRPLTRRLMRAVARQLAVNPNSRSQSGAVT